MKQAEPPEACRPHGRPIRPVDVLHLASDSTFELYVEPSRALDAYYHPFAYAAWRSPELLEAAA